MATTIIKAQPDLSPKDMTKQIQTTIDDYAKKGGRIILTDGIFTVGSLKLCSNLHFTISESATLVFVTDKTLFPVIKTRWEGREKECYQACLFANDVHNLTIDGDGTIDGHGFEWWQEFQRLNKQVKFARPYLLSVEHSKNIKIKNLSFVNSPSWTLHPFDCDNVIINKISVKNPADSPNTDGCDPESCTNLRITNCLFDVGDDCIAIKAGTEDAKQILPCANVIISNCHMLHGHGGVVIGSEMSGNVKNVAISNCTFTDTDRGIRFKTRRGRGGVIENILISNITIDSTLCPIVMNLYYFCGEKGKDKLVWDKNPYPISKITPSIRHVRITGISATNIKSCAGLIYGLPEKPIEDIHITDSSFYLATDCQPTEPAMFADAPKLTEKGFFIENTSNCELTNYLVNGEKGNAIFHDVNNLNFKEDEF